MARYKPGARRTALLAVLVWLVGVVGLAGVAWYAGRRTAGRMADYARHIAALDFAQGADPRPLLENASEELGAYAEPFAAFASALGTAHQQTAEAKHHVAALLQINPHYVLLCTLDGHIVDANPAFYAMSGLPFEAVRGNRIEVLNEVMPVEPLFELARRSLREGASIGGIEYALINRDDVRRPVQVSLRAVLVEGKEGVMIQATDLANQRTLERQIANFSDALDLMVDQRVAQLTASSASLGQLLDDVGLAVAAFDEREMTREWSRGAEALTGRSLPLVPHFTAVAEALGLSDAAREAFIGWYREAAPRPFTVEVVTPAGRAEWVVWKVARQERGEGGLQRALIGFSLGPIRPMAGDGQEGAAPLVEGALLDHASCKYV